MLGWLITIANSLFSFFYAIYALLSNVTTVFDTLREFWDFSIDMATIYLGNFPAPILMIAFIFLNIIVFKIVIEVI